MFEQGGLPLFNFAGELLKENVRQGRSGQGSSLSREFLDVLLCNAN